MGVDEGMVIIAGWKAGDVDIWQFPEEFREPNGTYWNDTTFEWIQTDYLSGDLDTTYVGVVIKYWDRNAVKPISIDLEWVHASMTKLADAIPEEHRETLGKNNINPSIWMVPTYS